MKLIKQINEAARAIPGKPAWDEAVERGKRLVAEHRKANRSNKEMAWLLYNQMQNVPKKFFLDMLKILDVTPDHKFQRELEISASKR